MLLALFGISNDTLNLAVNLLVLSLVVVYFALVAWTYFDARRRMRDPVLVASSVGASFVFPFIGTIVYSILRPPEFIEDAHERELEIRAAELRVRQLSEQSCPKCEFPVEKSFLRCPSCRARLRDPCASCGKPIDPRWALCPYCETPVERAAPERRPAAREGARPVREAKSAPEGRPVAREGMSIVREGKSAREAKRAREPRTQREQRRAAGGQQRAPSKRAKREADQQRRKSGSSTPRRPSARPGPAEKGEGAQREREPEAEGPSEGQSADEERSRPTTAP